MIWTNPGHELEQPAQRALEKYQGRRLYIYGAGLVGTRAASSILHLTDWSLAGLIDQDPKKQGCCINGVKVYALRDVLDREDLDSCQFLMGLTGSAGADVKKELDRILQERGTDMRCISYEDFMGRDFPSITSWHFQKIFVHSLSLIVTDKCTLNCKNCAIMLPYFKESAVYTLEELEQSIDTAFQKIDFIGDFTVTGGEPLLCGQLEQVLAYAGRRYRDRIGSFKIITNGTISPSQGLLEVMKTYDIDAEVSDYTKAVPEIKARVERTVAAFRENGISCHFLSDAQWVDFGFTKPDKDWSTDQLTAFFDFCSTTCRGYVNGEIWYCINAGFAERALGRVPDPDNRLDLRKVGDSLEERRAIVEFDMGFNKKGYVQMCRRCNGSCEINTHFIEVGEQWNGR